MSNDRIKKYSLALLLLPLTSVCYSQNDSLGVLINRYSLDSALVKSWQTDKSGCRKHLNGIDTVKNIRGISMRDFFGLLGKPNSLTNEYGEKENIKDTIICTYYTFIHCTSQKEKGHASEEIIVLFINDKLINIDRKVID